MRPAASPNANNPTRDSRVTTTSACQLAGVTSPYPIVANVCTLKKKASGKAAHPAVAERPVKASGPIAIYAAAKAAFARMYQTAVKARKRGQEISNRK